ncbi:MAG: insulinase family protein, partial [Verrucomicrobiota bacterium]|nr:insulinase family protein [Verrucomicrobiota bacterium]
SGHSSRLYQEIREKRALAHSIDAWTYNPGNPGLFGISAVVDGDKFEATRSAILSQLDRVKNELVTKSELTKAIKQFTAATLSTKKTMQGQAQDTGGNWLAANDLNLSERFLAAIQYLTPEDIQRVARTYLTASNRTLYALLPTGSKVTTIESREAIVDYPIQKFDLPNGLRVLLKEDHRLPFVEMRTVFQGGVLSESVETNGASQLVAKTLLKGTATRSAEMIASEIETLGGSIDSYGGNNSFGINTEVLSGDFEQGLELLADVVLNSAFPESALEREKLVQLANIRAQRDHLLQSAGRLMRRTMFGQTGYGLDVNGSEESLGRINREELLRFVERLMSPANCVLAIFGDISVARAKSLIEEKFGKWNQTKELIKYSGTPPIIQGQVKVHESRDKKQGVIIVAFPGVTIYDQARFPLELLQEALSDLGSRLFVRIREKLGLAYYVGAQHFIGLQPGYFALYAGTAPESIAQVRSEIFSEVETLRREGITAEELKRAKAKLLGQKKIARQDLGSYAVATALDELYGLGYQNCDLEDANYEQVTQEEVHAAIVKYLRPETCVVSTAGPTAA